MRFAKQHPMLVELDLSSLTIKADDAVAMIRQLRSLKYFEFAIKDRTEYNSLMNQLQYMIRFENKFCDIFPSLMIVELKIHQRL